jgi:hypothetical protein
MTRRLLLPNGSWTWVHASGCLEVLQFCLRDASSAVAAALLTPLACA